MVGWGGEDGCRAEDGEEEEEVVAPHVVLGVCLVKGELLCFYLCLRINSGLYLCG